MIKDVFVCFLLQTGFTIGCIFLFGALIGWCNRRFYANFGKYSRFVCRFTGAVGTPVHEASHALMCLIFGHKIVEIKLYRINASDGVLGYVSHTYNKRSFYQRAGNFFIGVAPILVISLFLALISYLIVPGMFKDMFGAAGENSLSGGVFEAFGALADMFLIVFSYAGEWKWWLFILFGAFFALHMNLSKADLKGAASGAVLLLVLLMITDLALAFVNKNLLFVFTRAILRAANFMICFLLLSLMISLVLLLVSFIIKKWTHGKGA